MGEVHYEPLADPVEERYRGTVLAEIWREVCRARSLHEPMHSDHEAYGVIKEEFDELWDEMKKNPRKMTPEQRESWKAKKREEAVQTAAMCVRYILDVLD